MKTKKFKHINGQEAEAVRSMTSNKWYCFGVEFQDLRSLLLYTSQTGWTEQTKICTELNNYVHLQ